jgi:hypothetical protein
MPNYQVFEMVKKAKFLLLLTFLKSTFKNKFFKKNKNKN